MTCRQRDKLLAPTIEERVGTNKKRIGPLSLPKILSGLGFALWGRIIA
jgi:hypothetical protein